MKKIIISNGNHTITQIALNKNYYYNKYLVYEYCEILNIKDEVKHPTYKKKILELYNIN